AGGAAGCGEGDVSSGSRGSGFATGATLGCAATAGGAVSAFGGMAADLGGTAAGLGGVTLSSCTGAIGFEAPGTFSVSGRTGARAAACGSALDGAAPLLSG